MRYNNGVMNRVEILSLQKSCTAFEPQLQFLTRVCLYILIDSRQMRVYICVYIYTYHNVFHPVCPVKWKMCGGYRENFGRG